MKGKIIAISLCAVMALGIGTTVAYYNTKSFGFDEDVKIISKEKNKITIMDYNIYYEDIDRMYEQIERVVPDKIQTLAHYPVSDI